MLGTKEEITWCPGCTNFGILNAVKRAVGELIKEKKLRQREVVTVTGIGCHAKIYDYLNLSGFYSIHGRVLPTALGIKVGNPRLTVIGFGGDGDTYAEGISHFIHACRYNVDMTMIVHNNQVFALTTGQATPTTEEGFKGKSTPLGVFEKPLNPIALALLSGATFVARGYALYVDHLKRLIKEGIKHKGYALIDVLQPCITFHDIRDWLEKRMYKLEKKGHDPRSFEKAMRKALEWDYNLERGDKVPIGVFYRAREKTYEEHWPQLRAWYKYERKIRVREVLKEFL
ncbi:MAG: 2-oxoacid:ferredoxin oxidoreductase subunit beta [Nanoarchaeota archaeon]|nr:2-oxoacid:ferredoxin oxidoreductase subunit beta [Nanoarchaeota archaeon]